MAISTSSLVMTAPRPVHPFFEHAYRLEKPESHDLQNGNSQVEESKNIATNLYAPTNLQAEPGSNPQTADEVSEIAQSSENNLTECGRLSPDSEDHDVDSSLAYDTFETSGRRKRRRTPPGAGHPQDSETGSSIKRSRDNHLQEPYILEHNRDEAQEAVNEHFSHPSLVNLPFSTPQGVVESTATDNIHVNPTNYRDVKDENYETQASKSPKILKLNGRGGFKTPTVMKTTRATNETSVNLKRKQRLVILKYGVESLEKRHELGIRIDGILATTKLAPSVTVNMKKAPPRNRSTPARATHPFFLGKAALSRTPEHDRVATSEGSAASVCTRRMKSFTTPGKMKSLMEASRNGSSLSTSTTRSYPIAASRAFNLPGTFEAPFPWQGLNGRSSEVSAQAKLSISKNALPPPFCKRKRKEKVSHIDASESVVYRFANRLQLRFDISDIPATVPYLPMRRIVPGHDVQKRVAAELSGIGFSNGAISARFASLSSALSSHDKGLCAKLPWTQKYAPENTKSVLMSSNEADILKSWLLDLKIDAVHKGLADADARQNASIKLAKHRAKRRRGKYRDELDDFVVSSDDEIDEMVELTRANAPPEDDTSVRSLVRAGDSQVNASNRAAAILMSGPHGCGKSACVFATAKELGYDIFEINAGTRRSGKDILERIGDMTYNHQVRKIAQDPRDDTVDSSDEYALSAVSDDQQKSLTSFFGQAVKKCVDVPKVSSLIKPKALGTQSAPKPRRQNQSLILFEEVDILFEEDRQFWDTVLDLAITSKRPIVMTCTDESLVPLKSLSLHAILRLEAPPIDLTADYLLLIAALEGHLLRRKVVLDMTRSTGGDLRASMTALEFWCQMGVGDQKGGLDWMFQRWPPGIDLDENGNVLRLMSDNTYINNMDWITHDVLEDESLRNDEREQRIINALAAERDTSLSSFGYDESGILSNAKDSDLAEVQMESRDGLDQFQHQAEHYSISDILSGVQSGRRSQSIDTLDPTMPPLPQAVLNSYTTGYPLLQADIQTDYAHTDNLISSTLQWAALTETRRVTSRSEQPTSRTAPMSAITSAFESLVLERSPSRNLTRGDFANAFNPLSFEDDAPVTHGQEFQASSFNRNLALIAEDISPYVRNIVSFDIQLEERRARLDGILSGGEKDSKRKRTTRASRSALEGSQRATTRRERWFKKALDAKQVLRTGGSAWRQRNEESAQSTRESSEAAMEMLSQE